MREVPDHDAAIVACRPVSGRRLAELLPGMPIPDPHNHSVLDECLMCDEPLWVGPTQAQYLRENPRKGMLVCFCCVHHAAQQAKASGMSLPKNATALSPNTTTLRENFR